MDTENIILTVTAGRKRFFAMLPQSTASERLAEKCPIAGEFLRSGDYEFFRWLDSGIDASGATIVSELRRGGIYYLAEYNSLSFCCRDADISPYSVAYLGEFDIGLCDVLEKARGSIELIIER